MAFKKRPAAAKRQRSRKRSVGGGGEGIGDRIRKGELKRGARERAKALIRKQLSRRFRQMPGDIELNGVVYRWTVVDSFRLRNIAHKSESNSAGTSVSTEATTSVAGATSRCFLDDHSNTPFDHTQYELPSDVSTSTPPSESDQQTPEKQLASTVERNTLDLIQYEMPSPHRSISDGVTEKPIDDTAKLAEKEVIQNMSSSEHTSSANAEGSRGAQLTTAVNTAVQEATADEEQARRLRMDIHINLHLDAQPPLTIELNQVQLNCPPPHSVAVNGEQLMPPAPN